MRLGVLMDSPLGFRIVSRTHAPAHDWWFATTLPSGTAHWGHSWAKIALQRAPREVDGGILLAAARSKWKSRLRPTAPGFMRYGTAAEGTRA